MWVPFPSFSYQIFRKNESVLAKTNLSFQNCVVFHVFVVEAFVGHSDIFGNP